MAEQSFAPENIRPTNESVFNENPHKQNILDITKLKIIQDFKQIEITERDKGRQKMFEFGSAFEDLANTENRLKSKETDKQRHLREIIENMYMQAELVLGTAHERPSKPDGISVGFDKKGKLIIDEIIEFKSSENAFMHGLDKSQAPKTLETIGNIVSILNKLTSGVKTVEIKPVDPALSLDKKIKRDTLLRQIQQQISKVVSNGDKITFSPELIYKLIIPKGVQVPKFDSSYLEDLGYAVKMQISESSFSKIDVHTVVDHLTKNQRH